MNVRGRREVKELTRCLPGSKVEGPGRHWWLPASGSSPQALVPMSLAAAGVRSPPGS